MTARTMKKLFLTFNWEEMYYINCFTHLLITLREKVNDLGYDVTVSM